MRLMGVPVFWGGLGGLMRLMERGRKAAGAFLEGFDPRSGLLSRNLRGCWKVDVWRGMREALMLRIPSENVKFNYYEGFGIYQC